MAKGLRPSVRKIDGKIYKLLYSGLDKKRAEIAVGSGKRAGYSRRKVKYQGAYDVYQRSIRT